MNSIGAVMPQTDRLDERIKAGCIGALKSEEIQALFKQFAYDAASASTKRHLLTLGIGSEEDEVERWRSNFQFVDQSHKRCNKVYDKAMSTVVGVVAAASCGAAYLLLKHFIPTLP